MAWKAYDSFGGEIQRSITDLPVGTVVGNARQAAPVGWLDCDGSAVSRAVYPDLFAAIGTAYGSGNGTTTFNVPNSDGEMILAVPTADKLGITDGSNIIAGSVTSAKLAPGATSATFSSTLPASPVDGQIVYYQASGIMAASGIVWQMRYNASSSSAYKWEFVGGTALLTVDNTETSTSSTSWGGVGPSLTVPLAGDYVVGYSATYYNSGASDYGWLSISVAGSTASSSGDAVLANVFAINRWVSLSRLGVRKNAVSANSEIAHRYQVSSGTGFFGYRSLSAVPVRVG